LQIHNIIFGKNLQGMGFCYLFVDEKNSKAAVQSQNEFLNDTFTNINWQTEQVVPPTSLGS